MFTPVNVGNLCNSESEPEVDARLKLIENTETNTFCCGVKHSSSVVTSPFIQN